MLATRSTLAGVVQKIYQQLVMLVVVAIVLLAAYVSAGRQFMPAISRYAGFLEHQILRTTGLPVAVDALTGSFRRFNPVIHIDGLRLAVGNDSPAVTAVANGLYFRQATIEVDMMRSLWHRRWVLEQFAIENLELVLEQNAAGGWLLSGLDMTDGNEWVDPASLYQALLGFSHLELTDVLVHVRTHSGQALSFTDGLITIQNQGDVHFLHMDASLQQNPRQLSLSMEVRGDRLTEVAGQLHLAIPEADYSTLLAGQTFGQVTIHGLQGRGELWLELADGKLVAAHSTMDLDQLVLALADSQPLQLDQLNGTIAVARGLALDHWEIALADMGVNFGDELWRGFNGYLYWMPGQLLSARADRVELVLLSRLALASGLLQQPARQQLAAHAPAGSLQHVSLQMPLAAVDQPWTLRTNVLDGKLASVRGSPNLWGVNGFLQAEFDRSRQRLSAMGELESEDFSINIPNTFTRVWDYDYVNGRLFIEMDFNDGVRTQLLSNTVVAESAALDGKLQFASQVHRFPDGRREANLQLMVGSVRGDAALTALYLPDGPEVRPPLRRNMEFLERAIVAGDLSDSGLLFRGSTVPGSPAVSKTFQSFFRLADGVIHFSDQWPMLQQLSGLVLTDDNKMDLAVSEASSLGIRLTDAGGKIRRDEEGDNWLHITSRARAATADGLDYLQQMPVDASVRKTFSSWQASGELEADVALRIPLNQPEQAADVRLAMLLQDNELSIGELDLQLSALSGPVVFDTRSGLAPNQLTARLFGEAVELDLSSEFAAGSIAAIQLAARGRATPEALSTWSGQNQLVSALLARMSGAFDYAAQLRIERGGTGAADAVDNVLRIESDLLGTDLLLPEPLGKPADQPMPLALQLAFATDSLGVRASLGTELDLDLLIADGAVQQGSLTLGLDAPPPAPTLGGEPASGLVVGAQLERLDLSAWTELVTALDATTAGTLGQGSNIARIDVHTDLLSLYGQQLPAVQLQLVPDAVAGGWQTDIRSPAVAGKVLVPYDSEDYLQVDLDYLHLPGNDQEGNNEAQPVAMEVAAQTATSTVDEAGEQQSEQRPPPQQQQPPRVDPLLAIDPRKLPLMRFSTDDFVIGNRDWGSWQFRLVPTDHGAEFYGLNFDFRGLRLGRDEQDERIEVLAPHFRWQFDGTTHRSELAGVLIADDIGAVLEANGYAPSLESDFAAFVTEVTWPGSPAFFSADGLSGRIDLLVDDGRFLRNSGGQGALRLVSFINLTAIFQRLKFSDDLLRRGLAFDKISGKFALDNGRLHIRDRLVISGPSSLYQITGDVDLAEEVVEGEMYVTLPISDNLPWIGLLTANLPLAVGAYLFDQIFGDQVDSLSSAVYTLSGPLEGLEPEFKQAFGSPDTTVEENPAPEP